MTINQKHTKDSQKPTEENISIIQNKIIKTQKEREKEWKKYKITEKIGFKIAIIHIYQSLS